MVRKLPKPRRKRGSSLRAWTQIGFLALTLVFVFALRANAERFCPFGGVEAIYAYVTEGNTLCSVGVSNFFVLGGVLMTVVLLRRAFCGYACPVGTIQEWVRKGAARLGVPRIRVGRGADRWLGLLKYALLVFLLVITWRASELLFREACPAYALLSRHGEDITYWAYVVSGAILVAALFLDVPFCRWFCPLAAVMNPFSKVGVGRVARDTNACVACGKCDEVCPMAIPVSEVEEVTHARCVACLQCVDACPKHKGGTLAWRMPPRKAPVPQVAIVGIFLLVVGGMVLASELNPLPSFTFVKGEAPATTKTIELQVHELSCRGRATLLRYFLERDDELELDGYVKLEAWPTPEQAARVRVTFDPEAIDELGLKDAIVQPYWDAGLHDWRHAPFVIEGYDPLGGP